MTIAKFLVVLQQEIQGQRWTLEWSSLHINGRSPEQIVYARIFPYEEHYIAGVTAARALGLSHRESFLVMEAGECLSLSLQEQGKLRAWALRQKYLQLAGISSQQEQHVTLTIVRRAFLRYVRRRVS